MTKARWLAVVVGGLAVTAVLSSQLWGGGRNRKDRQPILPGDGARTAAGKAADQEAALAQSKFAQGGVVTYKPEQGELYFALQLQPKLDPVPRRPRDYLIVVSTSAGQAGPAWTAATQLAEGVIKTAGPQDKVSLWCVSTPEEKFTRCLSGGFLSAKTDAKKLENALTTLVNKQYPAGDSDLKSALKKALATFPGGDPDARQRVVLYLGDGMSTHAPLSAADRTDLARSMVENRITFFPVPLGKQLHPYNLHGLATGSGGAVVRVELLKDQREVALERLEAAFAAPVLYPRDKGLTLPASVTEHYPTRLPPLRPDSPTLVVGRMKDARALALSVTGSVAGKFGPVTVPLTEAVRPAEPDNFFLVSMAQQWQNARDQHDPFRADRALALAYEQNRLDRMELLRNAEEALRQNELRDAAQLYERAKQLGPHDAEAAAGLKIVASLKSGRLTREDLRKQLNREDRQVLRVNQRGGVSRLTKQELIQLAQAGEEKLKAPKVAEPDAGGKRPEDLLQAHRDRMLVEEQKLSQAVEANLRQARRELTTDPDAAYALVRSTLVRVRDNPDLGERTRDDLMRRLQNELRSIQIRGAEVKLRDAQNRQLQEMAMRNRDNALQAQAEQERDEARFRVYRNLMNVARFERYTEEKILEGLRQMQVDAALRGQRAPLATQAAYQETQAAFNLQVQNELRRRKEQGFLAVMLEVQKSHIPFPDEPPIHYPPLATWQAITKMRKEKYEVTNLPDDPKMRMAAQRIQKLLEESIDMKDFQAPMSLKEALGLIQDKLNARYKEEDVLPILIDAEAFKDDNQEAPDVYETPVKFPPFPRKMSIATALRIALSKVATGNATYLIRGNFIEVTTVERQTKERVLAVYPVGDLVIPIAMRFNPFAMQMMGGALGMNMMGGFGMNGMMMGMNMGMMGMGGMGMMGMMGGGMGMMGGGMGMMGMMGAMGMGGMGMAGMGMGGMGMMGMQMGMGGMGMMGMNMGMMGMGMAGQGGMNCLGFNQMNGGLGFRGATMNQGLILLIQQLVAPGEWGAQRCQTQTPFFGLPGGGVPPGGGLPGGPPLPNEQGGPAPDIKNSNTIGFYAPALALVVRGTSRVHTNPFGGLTNIKKGGAAEEIGARPGLVAVKAPKKGDKVVQVAPASGEEMDPTKIWQEALAQGVDDPGIIIATADFLFEHKKYKHAVEFLKANLRQGVLVRPWVYEALAIALEADHGDADEIRRARLSALALDPSDASGYLRAARAMAEHKEYGRALAFCKEAAKLEPNSPHPYADALAYAGQAGDAGGMEWAAGNLLKQDWPVDSPRLHEQARSGIVTLAGKLEDEQHRAEAERLRATLRQARKRDLVINLTWEKGVSGPADLELEVTEPCGSVCSSELRQTPGGGAWTGNLVPVAGSEALSRPFASYAAAAAFSGEYRIKVRRVWGQPLGGRARLEIIQHQGTPKESRRLETVRIDNATTLKITLKDGRRTQLVTVTPAATVRRAEVRDEKVKEKRIIEKLRDIADPVYVAGPPQRITGNAGLDRFRALTRDEALKQLEAKSPVSAAAPSRQPGERPAFQTGIAAPSAAGVNLSATGTISPDQQYLRLSVTPLFGAGSASGLSRPKSSLATVPGGAQP